MPKVEAIPTRVPVVLGPISAWFTPNPPAAAPVKRFVMHINITIMEIDSKNGIIKRHSADPKNPIEFNVFLTLITLMPLLINLSARYPPALSAITDIILGIIIRITKALDSSSIPSSLSINLGKNDKKTNKLQLLAKVAATIAKKGLLKNNCIKGILFAGLDDGAFS